jgi:hypothetical protein
VTEARNRLIEERFDFQKELMDKSDIAVQGRQSTASQSPFGRVFNPGKVERAERENLAVSHFSATDAP